MARVSVADMPKRSVTTKSSKFAEQKAELDELLAEGITDEALCFENVTEAEKSALVSALRATGKDHGRKIKTVERNGHLYVADDGEYVGRPKEETKSEPVAEKPKSRRPRAAAN
jgi:hypothetical protein